MKARLNGCRVLAVALCFLAGVALADNACIEGGPHLIDVTYTNGGFVPGATVIPTNIAVGVGEFVNPPLAYNLSVTGGVESAQVIFDCIPTEYSTNLPIDYAVGTYFVPPMPSVFWVPGTNTYTAEAVATGGSSPLTNILGTVTINVLTNSPDMLLDVDLGGGSISAKTGYAAFGDSSVDFWNYGSTSQTALNNLLTAEQVVSSVGMLVSNLSSSGTDGSSDPMYNGYRHATSGQTAALIITNLPAGAWNMSLYSDDGDFTLSVLDTNNNVIETYGTQVCYDPSPSTSVLWQQGIQYAVFQGVSVGSGQSVNIGVNPGVNGTALISGLQIASANHNPVALLPPSGLVSWWRAEGNALDSVGSNNGTATGTTSYAPGMAGQAFQFNSYADQINLSASPSLDLQTNTGFTVEGWIYMTQLDGQGIMLWNNNPKIGIEAGGYPIIYLVDSGSTNHTVESPSRLATNVFTHVAFTYDKPSGLTTVYCNGLVATQEEIRGFIPISTNNIHLGSSSTAVTRLDEVALFNRALSSNEIAAIYHSGSAGMSNSATTLDSDYDGVSDAHELADRTDPNNPNSVLPIELGSWSFDNTNTWVGDQGQLPLTTTNIFGIPSRETNAVLIDSNNPAILCYRDVETNGDANINLRCGTVSFWFKPDWSSVSLGGTGPGSYGRLIEMGTNNPNSSTGSWGIVTNSGWWSLCFSTNGNQFAFGSSTNSAGGINLSTPISFASNQWHQIVLTYTPTNSLLYLDGELATNGVGPIYYPNATQRAAGFRIGSDQNGNNQAGGAFDELQTFNFPVSSNWIQSNFLYFPESPLIVEQATNQTVIQGSNVIFSVTAVGTVPLSYQWYSNSMPLLDATNAALTFNPANTNDVASYYVVVTNNYGTVTSSIASLTVSVLTTPIQMNIPVGGTANISVFVDSSCAGPFTYQWQHDGTNINGNGFIPMAPGNYANAIIMTVAGNTNGSQGYSGDGGSATAPNAALTGPSGVAVDACGNIYIVDSGNNAIRRVDTNGLIMTVAGNTNGYHGYSGDGGPATNAVLFNPARVAVDVYGDIYFSDSGNNVVREINTNGIIATVAGNTYQSLPIDGDEATNTSLNVPVGVAVDAFGNLYIADFGNGAVEEVTNGIITILSKNLNLVDVALDTFGNIYIADPSDNNIQEINTGGATPVAGGITHPNGLAVDAYGNIYVADSGNNLIWQVNTNGSMTIVAGNGDASYFGDGGLATNAAINGPTAVAVDVNDNLYIADSGNNVIREVCPTNILMQDGALTLFGVTTNIQGTYQVVISSPCGTWISPAATMTVGFPPSIIIQPTNQTVLQGSNAIFSVTPAGMAPFSYQWYSNSTEIVDATNAMETFDNIETTNDCFVVVSNYYGSITSCVVTVTAVVPQLLNVSGNDQQGLTNTWLPMPLTVEMTDTNSLSLTNLPVIFTVASGDGLIASSSNGAASTLVQVSTDTNAQASVWLELPANIGATFVTVTSGNPACTNQITYREIALTPGEIPDVAIGGESIMEVTGNGDVISWGGNQYGEFGDDTYLDGNAPLLASNVPVHIVGLTNIVKIAAGFSHTLAIDATGTLWAWGDDDWGQLGDSNVLAGSGIEITTNVPEQIAGMTNVIAIAASEAGAPEEAYSCAIKSDGSVWAWGARIDTDDGNTYATNFPVQVQGLPTNVVAIAAESAFSGVLLNDGTVWTWRDDWSGDPAATPAQVSGLSNIVSICAGFNGALALDSSGNVWTWDAYQDLGIVGGVSNILAVAVGDSHFLAVDATGQLWAWGNDNVGQLGDGGRGANNPAPIGGMTNILSVAAGSDASAVVDANGNLWQFGASDDDGNTWQWGDENEYPAMAPQYSDFYHGQLPNLTITNGNNQTTFGTLKFAQPLVVQVADTNGVALSNAPVSIQVVEGDMELQIGGTNYTGLRLTTDMNGEVSFLGIADSSITNTNCLVRVLAASREKVQEVDFTETVFPQVYPTIAITTPINGSNYLFTANQTMPVVVDAELGSGSAIQQVDYQMSTNGGVSYEPLYVSTNSPFSFTWTNTAWWSNAFYGQYILSAVATDNLGLQSSPSTASFTVALADPDGNGLADYWEIQYFGTNDLDPNSSPDGNGQTLLYDYQNGINPTDYYDGNLPNIQLTNQDNLVEANQLGYPGSYLPVPLTAFITDASNNPLTNAPVTFTIPLGNIQFAAATNDIPTTNLTVRTDTNGSASVWVYFPTNAYFIENIASVQAGLATTSAIIASDLDGNGLPDYWEIEYFGTNGLNPNLSLAGNGQTLLYDYENDINPTNYYNGASAYLTIVSGNDQSGKYNSFLLEPLTVQVISANWAIFTNAPVNFTVTNGTALLAANTNDTPSSTLTLQTDTSGMASVWVYFPPESSNPPDSTIMLSAVGETNVAPVAAYEYVPLAHWTFNDTNAWAGEEGQMPILATNVIGVPDWSSNAVWVDSTNPAAIFYNAVETNGSFNIKSDTGSILFWFKPDSNGGWSGGYDSNGILIEISSTNSAFTNSQWGIFSLPDGEFQFSTADQTRSFWSPIQLFSNQWYQLAFTYAPGNCAGYIDGQSMPSYYSTPNPNYFTNTDVLTNGFMVSIGSDLNGNNQAGGTFDELQTYDYPLSPDQVATSDSEIADWWELDNFGALGLNPDSEFYSPELAGTYLPGYGEITNGYVPLSLSYNYNLNPNILGFSLSFTNLFVNDTNISFQINNVSGLPATMAVVPLRSYDYFSNAAAMPFITSSYAANANWVPYTSNVVANLNSGDGDYVVWVGLQNADQQDGVPYNYPVWQCIKVTLESTPPILTLTSPTNCTVSKPIVQLQGYANVALSGLTYDISNATGILTNQSGYMTGQIYDTNQLKFTTNDFQCYNVTLAMGSNCITLHATDEAGNSVETNLYIAYDTNSLSSATDTNPPALSIVWPQSGIAISGTNCTIQAQVDDPMDTVTATVIDTNGDTNTVQGIVEQSGLVWLQNIPIANGANSVTVTATDLSGDTTITNLSLSQSPVFATVNLLTNDQMGQASVTATGTISEQGYSLTVNGITATVNADGTWVATNVPVNISGTAVFDMEIYVGDPTLIGSQVTAFAIPVKVGLESFQGSSDDAAVDWKRAGMYNGVLGAPSFSDFEDTVNWNYQSGGWDQGSDSASAMIDWGTPNSYTWSGPFLGHEVYEYWADYAPGLPTEQWSTKLPAGQDKYSAPWEMTSDFKSRVMLEPQGKAQAGTTVTYLVQAEARYTTGNIPIPAESITINGSFLEPYLTNSDGTIWGQTLVSGPAGVNLDVTPIVPGEYSYNVVAFQVGRMIAVDNNRDGEISFSNDDATTPNNPYRFWIDDSKESGDDVTSTGGSDVQIPGQTALAYVTVDGDTLTSTNVNYLQGEIQGRSDLVNFFPVAINISNLLQLFPTSSGYEYHLYQADSAIPQGAGGLPPYGAISFVYSGLTGTNAFDYLTNTAGADYGGVNLNEDIGAAYTTNINTDVILDTNWLAQAQNNYGGIGIILIEGCSQAYHPLMFEIWHGGKLIAGEPLYISISGVEQMFRHYNLCQYGNGTPTVDSRYTASNEPSTENKNLVFLHGYNVNQQEARGVESEVFKRFYWSGSKARFYGVTWNGAVSQGNYITDITTDYQTNVVNAFQTAQSLSELIKGLPGQTVVIAHSMGNLVVLSAIADYGAAPNDYFMVDSAAPIEAVDGSAPMTNDMVYDGSAGNWLDYSNELWASKWFTLWPTNDARSTLTWSNRLSNFGGVPCYNFYSSGEDVLRDYPGVPPSSLYSSLSDIISEIKNGISDASYVWVWEEKDKGQMAGDDFISSDHGGWSFNPNYYSNFSPLNNNTLMAYSEAASLPNSQLETNAFFDFSSAYTGDLLYGGIAPAVSDTADLALYGSGGNAYASANRDRILSDAIPALTLPIGANILDVLGGAHNIDMSSPDQVQFSDFQNGWPSSRSTGPEALKWHHTDFANVAYPFVYPLYVKFVSLGNLK